MVSVASVSLAVSCRLRGRLRRTRVVGIHISPDQRRVSPPPQFVKEERASVKAAYAVSCSQSTVGRLWLSRYADPRQVDFCNAAFNASWSPCTMETHPPFTGSRVRENTVSATIRSRRHKDPPTFEKNI